EPCAALRRGVPRVRAGAVRVERVEAGGVEDGSGQGQVSGRLRTERGEAAARRGWAREGSQDADVPLAGVTASVEELLRPGRRQSGQGRQQRRDEAGGGRVVSVADAAWVVRTEC